MPRRLILHPDTGEFFWQSSFAHSVKKSINSTMAANFRSSMAEKAKITTLKDINEDEKKAKEAYQQERLKLQKELISLLAYKHACKKFNAGGGRSAEKDSTDEAQLQVPQIKIDQYSKSPNVLRLSPVPESTSEEHLTLQSHKDVEVTETLRHNFLRLHTNSSSSPEETESDSPSRSISGSSTGSSSSGHRPQIDISKNVDSTLSDTPLRQATRHSYDATAELTPSSTSIVKATLTVDESAHDDEHPFDQKEALDFFLTDIPSEDEEEEAFEDVTTRKSQSTPQYPLGSIQNPQIVPSYPLGSIHNPQIVPPRPPNIQRSYSDDMQYARSRAMSGSENLFKFALHKQSSFRSARLASEGDQTKRKLTMAEAIQKKLENRPKIWERLPHEAKESKIFPYNCRNTTALRRATWQEASKLITVWSPENVRRNKARLIQSSLSLPDIVNRKRTTSAIFRDYRSYRKDHPQGMGHYRKVKLSSMSAEIQARPKFYTAPYDPYHGD